MLPVAVGPLMAHYGTLCTSCFHIRPMARCLAAIEHDKHNSRDVKRVLIVSCAPGTKCADYDYFVAVAISPGLNHNLPGLCAFMLKYEHHYLCCLNSLMKRWPGYISIDLELN